MKQLFDLLFENRIRRGVALALALVVTFTTTYALVLPAITITRDQEETVAGLDLDQGEMPAEEAGISVGERAESREEAPEGDEETVTAPMSQEDGTVSFDAEITDAADGEARIMQVHVEADAGAFPEGAVMTVTPVTDKTVLETIGEAVEGEAVAVHAVDLAFRDAGGENVLPEKGCAVQVTLASDAMEGLDETAVVQYTGDGQSAEEIPALETLVFRTEPEIDIDTDHAVTFLLDSEKGLTFALVETEAQDEMQQEPTGQDQAPMAEEPEAEPAGEPRPEEESRSVIEKPWPVEEEPQSTEEAPWPIEEEPQSTEEAPWPIEVEPQSAEGEPGSIEEESWPIEEEVLPVAEESAPEAEPSPLSEILAAVNALAETVIEKTVLSSDGHSYRISVICGADAGIPEGAELDVREIPDASDSYDKYMENTAEALGVEAGSISYARFFDISIVKDGEKIQPEETVEVRLELADALTRDVKAVHFAGEDETEVLEARLTAPDAGAMESAVTIEAAGFSVYGIVTVDDLDRLDGQSYGIVNNQNTVSGTALMTGSTTVTISSVAKQALTGQTMTVRVDPVGRTDNVFVAENSNITMWSFNQISGDQANQYHITTTVNGALKYLSVSAAGVQLLDSPDETCAITVTAESGNYSGKYSFLGSDGKFLTLNGSNFAIADKSNNANVWMNLAQLSTLNDDDFVTYTATKVSVSDDENVYDKVVDGERKQSQVIIYTRIWNDQTKRYDYYAIDYDGKLVRAYESGDTISWVGSKVNTMLWEFTEYHYDDGSPNYYYELQNVYSGKYIAPQISGDGFLSDSTIGVNLNGRRNGQYYTTVLAWDDPYYDYASLMVRDGQLISAPMSRADTFYFAVMTPVQETEGQLEQVATMDHEPFGITLRMQDYGNINSNNRSQEQVDVLGDTRYNQWTGSPGLLEKNLSGEYPGDYPVSTETGRSLGELYDEAKEVNQQFLLSTYQETGYFEYDSTQNFAHLIWDEDDPWIGEERPDGGSYEIGDFVIYDQLGTTNEGNKDTLKHGQFLPYNDLMVKKSNGEWVPRSTSKKYKNEMDIHAKPLSSLDPRKGEELYEIPYKQGQTAPDYVDHFFGMEMSARFMQSENGLDAWGHDLIFEFSGDDDFWLYIDGKLVLDLGGIHSALDGSINFRTGQVIVNGRKTNLRTLYKEAYLEEHPGTGDAVVDDWLNTIFDDDGTNTGTVFKDYSGHSMRMFYMERGAGASNLHMRFNLAPYTEGEVLLEKEVSGAEAVASGTTFPFQIMVKDPDDLDGRFYPWTDRGKVTDEQSGVRVDYRESYSIGGITYSDVFLLKPGQTVSIKLPSEETHYYIKECGLDSGTYDAVYVNRSDTSLAPTVDTQNAVYRDYQIVDSTVEGRKKVIYDNHVSSSAQKNLSITKKLWQDNEMEHPITADEDNTEFRFRIYIGKDGDDYTVYNTGKYYVKDPAGCYCIFEDGQFRPTGKTDFSQLSTVVPEGQWKSEQEKATFYTSPGGAADKIKAGYTVEIPGLMAGTAFMVEERDNEIPAGYKRLEYTREGTIPDGETANAGEIRSDDQRVFVNNRHGYGLTVVKNWSDAAFMESHDPIYFAVYLKGTGENGQETLTLVDGSVRQMVSPATSYTWFFPSLEAGKTLNDYLVYEVVLEGGSVDPDTGAVEYSGIPRIEENGTLTVGGESNEQGYSDSWTYTTSYSRGFLSEEQLVADVNARTDTVSNARPGVKLVKTDWNGAPLEGAVFTLEKADGESNTKKTFTSGEDGLIAMAYLQPNTDYTLTETAAPSGYQSAIEPLTIRVDENDTVYVEGSDTVLEPVESPYTIRQVRNPTAANMPTITVKNKDFSLQAVKIDASSGEPLAGVTFALYKEVNEYGTGAPRPDYLPMEGYDELETDAKGVIPRIVLRNAENPTGLLPGTYYLRETGVSSAYQKLVIDIRIIISPTGDISIQSAVPPDQSGPWTMGDISDSIAKIQTSDSGGLTIKVKNTPKAPVRIKKLETGTDNTMDGVAFDLYKIGQIGNDGRPKQGETPVLSGVTRDGGILFLGNLEDKTSYYVYETGTLPGYNLLSAPVVITTVDGTVTASMLGSASLHCEKKDGVWEITVYNSPGYQLPSTGGPGTGVFTALGGALVLGAGSLLALKRKRPA